MKGKLEAEEKETKWEGTEAAEGRLLTAEKADRLERWLAFIKEAELLKDVLRTAWSSSGRQESTAEHTWRLALMAALFLEEYPQLDGKRVLLMCLLHDLGEIYDGDVSAALLPDEQKKHEEEERAVKKLVSLLPDDERKQFLSIWREYNENATPEAHLVKALDKAETILQHSQGKNPQGFDYDFNLQYGAAYFRDDCLLAALRARLDEETKKRIM